MQNNGYAEFNPNMVDNLKLDTSINTNILKIRILEPNGKIQHNRYFVGKVNIITNFNPQEKEFLPAPISIQSPLLKLERLVLSAMKFCSIKFTQDRDNFIKRKISTILIWIWQDSIFINLSTLNLKPTA